MSYAIMPSSDYKNICDAVRANQGTSKTYKSNEIANAIKIYSEHDDVCFWDYDGTLLYSCTLEEAKAMTELPTVPDHLKDNIPLVFEGWNWTLEEVNSLTRKADVGAMYSPADGKTHFTIRLTQVAGLTVTIGWYNRVADCTMTFDWGDGTTDEYMLGKLGSATITHTYNEYGIYNCTIDSNGCLWNPGESKGFIRETNGISSLTGKLVLDKNADWSYPGSQGTNCFLKANIETVILSPILSSITGVNCFSNCFHLKHINVPHDLNCLSTSFVLNCRNIRHISLPYNLIKICDYGLSGLSSIEEIRLPIGLNNSTEEYSASSRFIFNDNSALKNIQLPSIHTELGMREFQNCYSLKMLEIRESVTKINSSALANTGVTDFYFYPKIPPTLVDTTVFTNINAGAIIHVLAESEEAYKTATNWTLYANYIRGDL